MNKKVLALLILFFSVFLIFSPQESKAMSCKCKTSGPVTRIGSNTVTKCVTLPNQTDEVKACNDLAPTLKSDTDINSSCVAFSDNNCTVSSETQTRPSTLSNLQTDVLGNKRKPLLEINIPGLNFSNVASSSDESGTYVYIPWIQELITVLYKFGIAIVSIVAVVIIIIQGLRVITSAGGEAKNEAYKKILQSIIGLFIAWGSYAILYNINPALVQFNALKVKVIEGIPADFGTTELAPTLGTNAPSQVVVGGSLVKFCTDLESCKVACTSWHCGTNVSTDNCDLTTMPREGAGIIPLSDLTPSSRWPRMRNIDFGSDLQASQLVINGLTEADAYLSNSSKPNGGKGYRIKINNCWRDWRKDAARECGYILQNIDPNVKGLAWPGANPHSSGQACDLALYNQNNKPMTEPSGNLVLQGCDKWHSGSKILDEILTDPSVGGRRLVFEQWHYEWGNISNCRCTSADDCANYWRPSKANCAIGPFDIPQPSNGC